jgi:hypothetical protein
MSHLKMEPLDGFDGGKSVCDIGDNDFYMLYEFLKQDNSYSEELFPSGICYGKSSFIDSPETKNCIRISDNSIKKRLFKFKLLTELLQDTMQYFQTGKLTGRDKIGYIRIARSKDNVNLSLGIIFYPDNTQRIKMVAESFQHLGWFDVEGMLVKELSEFNTSCDINNNVWTFNDRIPCSNSAKGSITQYKNKIFRQKVRDSFSSMTSDLSNSSIHQFSSSRCNICFGYNCDKKYDTSGLCDFNLKPGVIYGYPEQLNLTHVDHLCFLTMIVLQFLTVEGQHKFEAVNRDLFDNLQSLFKHQSHSMVLKSTLVNIIGNNINLKSNPPEYFAAMAKHESIDFTIGINALFRHHVLGDNVFDVALKTDSFCVVCNNHLKSENLLYRILNDIVHIEGTVDEITSTEDIKRCCLGSSDQKKEIIRTYLLTNDPIFIFVGLNDGDESKTLDEKVSVRYNIPQVPKLINIGENKFHLIGCSYDYGKNIVSHTFCPNNHHLIEYNGKENFGRTLHIRCRIFPIQDAKIAVYVNEKYFDKSKFKEINYKEIDDDWIPKRVKYNRNQVSEDDLYVKESDHVTVDMEPIGKGLFPKIKVYEGDDIGEKFRGVHVPFDEYQNKPSEQKGYAVLILKGKLVLDCFLTRNGCKLSHANDPKNIIHKVTHVDAVANVRLIVSTQTFADGQKRCRLVAIKDIDIDEEILYSYAEEDDDYFETSSTSGITEDLEFYEF